MSITITGKFSHPYEARQAAERLRRRGYTVSMGEAKQPSPLTADPLLVAYPFGQPGGNSFGNNLMGGLPPLAGNGVLLHRPEKESEALVTVLTDDTQTRDARLLIESLGGVIL